MAAGFDLQQAGLGTGGVGDFGAAVAAGGGHLSQRGDPIELGHQARSCADGGGLIADQGAQAAEQFVFALGRAGLELLDGALAVAQGWGDEALLVGQGLAADPVLRHRRRLGLRHRQEVAEGAVVLEFEAGEAAEPALLGFLLGQPGVLVVELVAQLIEGRINAVVEQAALGEGEGWGVE